MAYIRGVAWGPEGNRATSWGFMESKSHVQSTASAEPGVLRNAGGDQAAWGLGPEVP